jgi:hypothetical protein
MNINFWAVLVSALASMVIGSVWYGPLFGKKFMVAMGMDKWSPEKQAAMKKTMGMSFVLQFVASLAMFIGLALMLALGRTIAEFASFSGAESDFVGWRVGLTSGFFIWLSFVVPVKLGEAIWGGSWTLFWLGIGNMFVTLLVAGAIIGAWR